jgi:hypothetical protein
MTLSALSARGERAALLWPLGVAVLVFVAALSPELLAGRVTFSSYMVLPDSAVHMLGASYLLQHGQSYTHLQANSSYGLYLQNYYGSGYPSGADTFFGGSSLLLRLPLLWSFQPFNALLLALATGPAWLLARHMGLKGALAAAAALTVTIPALVFAYELIASVKEITALPMLLALGALIVTYPRWRQHRVQDVIPFALLVAAGISALGLAFGAWTVGAALLFAGVALTGHFDVRSRLRRLLSLTGLGALIVFVGAWPTWAQFTRQIHIAQSIATTSKAGNLQQPLKFVQLFGVWLSGSYKNPPTAELTYALIVFTGLLVALGAGYLLRARTRVFALWIVLSVAVLAVISVYGGVWSDAKTLMLTSPLIMLLAWGGVAAVNSRSRALAFVLAFVLSAGVIASDALQYHAQNLAPTARYQELASVNTRFAGQGPTLVTDFDEYSLYVLRDLDVAGPDFAFHPPALSVLARGHGAPVHLELAAPTLLLPYKLIVSRRDPASARPPAAYSLAWQGTYYDVWRRRAHAKTALLDLAPTHNHSLISCKRILAAAQTARTHKAVLVVSRPALTVHLNLRRAQRSHNWIFTGDTLLMNGAGELSVRTRVPTSGVWELWIRGEIMRALTVSVDGRSLARISDQVAGNNENPNTMTPVRLHLKRGEHEIEFTRGGVNLAPGNGGSARISSAFLTPAQNDGRRPLARVLPARAHTLCGQKLSWIEVIPK